MYFYELIEKKAMKEGENPVNYIYMYHNIKLSCVYMHAGQFIYEVFIFMSY